MRIFGATTRVTFGLVCLGVSVWLIAYALGMFPDRREAVVAGRASLCENVALHCSLLASRNDRRAIETSLLGLVTRSDDVLSAAVRLRDDVLLASVGPHAGSWQLAPGTESTANEMRVPILAGDQEWGMVEVRFQDIAPNAMRAWGMHPLFVLGCFTAAATYLLYFFYLRKMLQHLDPSQVIPRRVRQTLDTLAEGLLVLDKHERILLANEAFASCIGAPAEELTGRRASELPWDTEEKRVAIEGYPWQRALLEAKPQVSDLLTIHDQQHQRRVLKVSATPIYGDQGEQRGAMASFDDVTNIEQNREELRQMLKTLSESRDEVHRQNLQLERLASRDSLTGCLNRRAFFTEMENQWSAAARHDHPLAVIMVDLDHFKSINDNHGHQTGDMVLERASQLLRQGRRPSDQVCRYGGEEFCILLPHTELDAACLVAEQVREVIAGADFNGLAVTASLGVSARMLGAGDPQQLIDQADKCLYVAKRAGRNCVVRFDQAAEPIAEFERLGAGATDREEPDTQTSQNAAAPAPEPTIPFQAVAALVSALAYRDQSTADHSRRVADLCVATAHRQMPHSESYVLEIAALLHDIGKIGVPDSILLKPGKLTSEEWQLMNSHERIGIEIVQSTFSNSTLAEIMRTYRAWFGGNPSHPELPLGDAISLPARILAIADAFDSMTNRTAYRAPLSREQAFEELRRCAPQQFDTDQVERFIEAVSSRATGATRLEIDASKAAALSLGTQIERLAEALDNQDLDGIGVLAARLNMAATKYDSPHIALAAAQIEEAAGGEHGVKELVQRTNELVDLCRSVQRAYLGDAVSPADDIRDRRCQAAPVERAAPLDAEISREAATAILTRSSEGPANA